jgi:hypothetical protein
VTYSDSCAECGRAIGGNRYAPYVTGKGTGSRRYSLAVTGLHRIGRAL